MFLHIIEGLSQLAAGAARRLAVDADVEELAVFRVGVAGVGLPEGLVYSGTIKVEHLWKVESEFCSDEDRDYFNSRNFGNNSLLKKQMKSAKVCSQLNCLNRKY